MIKHFFNNKNLIITYTNGFVFITTFFFLIIFFVITVSFLAFSVVLKHFFLHGICYKFSALFPLVVIMVIMYSLRWFFVLSCFLKDFIIMWILKIDYLINTYLFPLFCYCFQLPIFRVCISTIERYTSYLTSIKLTWTLN